MELEDEKLNDKLTDIDLIDRANTSRLKESQSNYDSFYECIVSSWIYLNIWNSNSIRNVCETIGWGKCFWVSIVV